MSEIIITIETDNAAFQDGNLGLEVARILRKLAAKYEADAETAGPLYDINGNRVGHVKD